MDEELKRSIEADCKRLRRSTILQEFSRELDRANTKYPGEDHMPDGTGGSGYRTYRDIAKLSCDRAQRENRLTHLHVLEEEVWEALAEEDPAKLRAELVQVGAMALRWIEDLDYRAATAAQTNPVIDPGQEALGQVVSAQAPAPTQVKLAHDPWTHPGHDRVVCSCGNVIRQCRCMGPKADKVEYRACPACKADAKMRSAPQAQHPAGCECLVCLPPF